MEMQIKPKFSLSSCKSLSCRCFTLVDKTHDRLRTSRGDAACYSLPSLELGNIGEGSSVDGCSELVGADDNRDWLLLLLVSLLNTGDWLLPVLWIGLEGQSSPGCFSGMSVVKDRK